MYSIKKSYVTGLILAGLSTGCGGGGTSQPTTSTPPPTSNTGMFSSDVMSVLNSKCKNCHGSNGNFKITDASATYANISDLKTSAKEAGQYLLDKGSNSVGHGGGEVIAPSSTQYATLKSWVDAGADFN